MKLGIQFLVQFFKKILVLVPVLEIRPESSFWFGSSKKFWFWFQFWKSDLVPVLGNPDQNQQLTAHKHPISPWF
jgi:hypothetical protein